MIRFDVVVANRDRTQVFWQGWSSFKNFDIAQDRLVFLNTSADPKRELAICLYYIDYYGLKGCNFVFLVRRSWNSVFGMLADYTRLIGEDVLDAPKHTFFMQDHYVCKTDFVAGDTIPENGIIDFDAISNIFKTDNKLVVGNTRYGFRLCATVPEELTGKDFESYDDKNGFPKPGLPWIFMPGKLGSTLYEKYCCDHFIYYHGGFHIEGSKDLGINFDGVNFCCDPKYIVNHYMKDKSLYYASLGDYGDALVWEARIGNILYDQGLGFYELSRNISVKSTEELKKLDPNPGTLVDKSLWCYHYNSPLFYAIHNAGDIWPYKFKQTEAYFRYKAFCEKWRETMEHDVRIYLLYDSKPFAVNFKGVYRSDLPEIFVNHMVKNIDEIARYNSTLVRAILLYRFINRFLNRRLWNPFSKGLKFCLNLPNRVVGKIKRITNF